MPTAQSEMPPRRRAANGAATSAVASSSASTSQSDECTANITAVATKIAAIVHASAPARPRTPSARLTSAPGISRHSGRRAQPQAEADALGGQQPRERQQRRREQPRAQLHRRSSRATCTSAGLRSSRAKTASTYGGRCGAGDSPGSSVIAQRLREPFAETGSTCSPVRSR